jgi:hypothetical protein
MRVELERPRATFGFVFSTETGRVTEAAPIARYIVGWPIDRAVGYFERRGGAVAMVATTL